MAIDMCLKHHIIFFSIVLLTPGFRCPSSGEKSSSEPQTCSQERNKIAHGSAVSNTRVKLDQLVRLQHQHSDTFGQQNWNAKSTLHYIHLFKLTMKLQELDSEVASPMCLRSILNSIKFGGGFDGFSVTKMDKATTSSCLSSHLILAENWNPRFLQFERMEPVPRFPISFCKQNGNQVHDKPWKILKILMTVGGTPN